jgi:hypothetical protein
VEGSEESWRRFYSYHGNDFDVDEEAEELGKDDNYDGTSKIATSTMG